MRNLAFLAVLALAGRAWSQAPPAQSGAGALSAGPAKIKLAPVPGLPHAFDVDVSAPRPVEIVSARVKDGDQTWGRFSALIDPPAAEASVQTASFRYLPARYTVEIEVAYQGGGSETRQLGPYSNAIQKMILVERDQYPQRAILTEGDGYLLFGRIVDISKISTGKLKYGGTPLGYYHVRNKEFFAVNQLQEWDMPYAHWYTPSEYPEGVNGLHQGFPGTSYGIRQSHGCTRMPEEFAKRMWAWADVGVPVIYLGDEFQTAFDRGRFLPGDARFFRLLLRDMLAYHEALQSGEEAPTCLSPDEAELVRRMRPYQDALLEACDQFRRFSQGEAFYSLVRQYASLRGLE